MSEQPPADREKTDRELEGFRRVFKIIITCLGIAAFLFIFLKAVV